MAMVSFARVAGAIFCVAMVAGYCWQRWSTTQRVRIRNGTDARISNIRVEVQFGHADVVALEPGQEEEVTFRDGGDGAYRVSVGAQEIGICGYTAGWPVAEQRVRITIRSATEVHCE
jgi:hypothetical protein